MLSKVIVKGLKILGGVTVAGLGILTGKNISDEKHKPIYEKQTKEAKIINDILKKRYGKGDSI